MSVWLRRITSFSKLIDRSCIGTANSSLVFIGNNQASLQRLEWILVDDLEK